MAIELRDYQGECVAAVDSARERGVERPVVVLPTGGGKTVVFAKVIAEVVADGGTALILAHRDELLDQARRKLLEITPELEMSIGLVKAGRNDVGSQVVIASVQTLSRQSRLDQLPEDFDIVVVDEAHHAVADSYQRIFDRVGGFILFVTATPKRADGKSLEDVVDEVVFARSLRWMIEQGYLCPPRGKRITVDVDLDGVKKSRGDFQADELADALEEAGTAAEVLASYQQHGEGRKTIVFAANVAMAHRMAEVFRDAGLAAEAVDGGTPPDERKEILERFHTGETQILCNVGVLVEGFDEPSVSCVILAAPTKSEVKYTQIIGRGLRLYPGKTDCLVLDVVGASEDKTIQSLAPLFGLGSLLEGEDALEAIARERREAEAAERAAGERAERERDAQADRRRRNAESIEFFSRARMNWITVGDRWTIALDRDRTIVLWPRVDDHYDVILLTSKYDPKTKKAERSFRPLSSGLDMGYAMGVAEESIRKYGKRILADAKAAWREDPVNPGQVRNLHRLRLSVPETKGEASDLIAEANLAEDLAALEGVLLEREGADLAVAA